MLKCYVHISFAYRFKGLIKFYKAKYGLIMLKIEYIIQMIVQNVKYAYIQNHLIGNCNIYQTGGNEL